MEGIKPDGRISERLAVYQQLVRLVAEQPAERDGDEQPEQRHVEEQIADLVQVSLLGRHPAVAGADPEATPAEQAGGRSKRLVRRTALQETCGLQEPAEVARCLGRRLPRRPGEPGTRRQYAPGKRGEE